MIIILSHIIPTTETNKLFQYGYWSKMFPTVRPFCSDSLETRHPINFNRSTFRAGKKKMAMSKLLFKILSTSSIHEVNNFV